MDDESDVTAQGEALHRLITAMRACDDARIPNNEILEIVRPHLREDDDDIIVIGALIEHLSDVHAMKIIQIVYAALLSGATFSFVDGHRSRLNLLELCEGTGGEVKFSREGHRRRVTVTKPPS